MRQTLAEQWQRADFDFLVNNAGIGIHAAFADTSEAQFDQLMNIQLKGPFFLTQALLPLIADGGRILNVSTGLTRFALPGYAAYAAMKGGVEVLTRYLAMNWGRAASRSTSSPPARLKPISAVAWCATTNRSTPTSPRRPRWAASAGPTTSAAPSPPCSATAPPGSTASG